MGGIEKGGVLRLGPGGLAITPIVWWPGRLFGILWEEMDIYNCGIPTIWCFG